MEKNMTKTGEALAAPQEATLAIELFLNENYRFRRNVLNGKVEYANLPKETGATLSGASDEAELVYRPLTQAALNSIVIRAKSRPRTIRVPIRLSFATARLLRL